MDSKIPVKAVVPQSRTHSSDLHGDHGQQGRKKEEIEMRLARAVLAFAFVIACGYVVRATPNVVKIDGGQIAGVAADGVRVFKGIPFAAPPVGDLRWSPPQPVVAWTGVKKADTFGPQCVQLPYPTGSPYASMSAPAPMSEDCLYLNVWTAAGANEKRPVMVWIYGGGWTRGAASRGLYDGAALARKGVVVVTANYRLGSLGFLAHPELTAESPHHSSGNYAILDQVAALQWVRKNISAFGGDPTNVTIFGESAGSWSVNTLQATPLAKGLFQKAIGESGARFELNPTFLTPDFPLLTPTIGQAEHSGTGLAKAVGANSLKELRSVPAEKLVAVESFRSSINVDGWVLPANVSTIFAQKKHSAVPVLVGSNANEWTTLSSPATFPKTLDDFHKRIEVQFPGLAKEFDDAYPVKSQADIADAILGLGRDNFFTLQMRTWARMATAGGKAFLYQFTHVPPSPRANEWGAFHASELEYVFGNLGKSFAFKYTETDLKLSDAMSSYWVNFAKTGDPNGKGLPAWTAYDADAEPYLDLGDTVQLKHHLLKAKLDFLERAQEARSSTAR
jgi:para-nitrobenzyl esterase